MAFFDDIVLPTGAGFALAEIGRLTSSDGPGGDPNLGRFSVPYFGIVVAGTAGVATARHVARRSPFLAFGLGAAAVGAALVIPKVVPEDR